VAGGTIRGELATLNGANAEYRGRPAGSVHVGLFSGFNLSIRKVGVRGTVFSDHDLISMVEHSVVMREVQSAQ